MKSKRLLSILSRYLWPVDGGRKESLNHYFKELYESYGYEIRLVCFLEYGQEISIKDIPEYISDVEALNDVSFFEKSKNLIIKSLGKKQWPFQCSLYYSYDNCLKIKKIIEEWQPDVIFTEMIRTCVYYNAIKDSKAKLLANLDDLLSARYERQIHYRNNKSNFAGSYNNKIPGFVSSIINNKAIRNEILKMESKRCAKWEKEYYRLFDYVLMTSDVERDILNKEMEGDKAKTLSVGIDYKYYSQNIIIEKDPIGLSYIGNFNVAANVDTLEMIINEVLPYVKSDFHFYIIGNCPNYIIEKYKDNKRLVFCGRVDDIRKYVKMASIFLAPIAYGTGIKTKIVEAMAMKMPVITNSIGAEGICAKSGIDYIVCDDTKEIAETVDILFNNPTKAKEIGENAGVFAREQFQWDKVLAVFKELGL